MNGTSDFLGSVGKLRENILGNKIGINDFVSQPAAALKNSDSDFFIRKGSEEVLFSDYLNSVSASARQVIIQSVIGMGHHKENHHDDRLEDIDDDGWIDEVGGGAAVALAVAVVNALAMANANAVANANALANANIMANVNGWAGSGGISASSQTQVQAGMLSQIILTEGALSPDLNAALTQRGLNTYRQSTLLKHLAEKNLRLNTAGCDGESVLDIAYKELNVKLTLASTPEGLQIIRADLLH